MLFDSILGRLKTSIPTAEEALPGRSSSPFKVPPGNVVLGHRLQPPFPDGIETAYFALGCFWGAEKLFWQLDGVYSTAVGYQNGHTPFPTYGEVCSGRTGHAEAVMVAFDPKVITYEELLQVFFTEHNPTQGMRQGMDRGSQYRSGIYTTTEAQMGSALRVMASYQEALTAKRKGLITTEVEPAGQFYFAEENHQQYLEKVPHGYCGLKGTGVTCQVPASAGSTTGT